MIAQDTFNPQRTNNVKSNYSLPFSFHKQADLFFQFLKFVDQCTMMYIFIYTNFKVKTQFRHIRDQFNFHYFLLEVMNNTITKIISWFTVCWCFSPFISLITKQCSNKIFDMVQFSLFLQIYTRHIRVLAFGTP